MCVTLPGTLLHIGSSVGVPSICPVVFLGENCDYKKEYAYKQIVRACVPLANMLTSVQSSCNAFKFVLIGLQQVKIVALLSSAPFAK